MKSAKHNGQSLSHAVPCASSQAYVCQNSTHINILVFHHCNALNGKLQKQTHTVTDSQTELPATAIRWKPHSNAVQFALCMHSAQDYILISCCDCDEDWVYARVAINDNR
jgi:hypothetical protein